MSARETVSSQSSPEIESEYAIFQSIEYTLNTETPSPSCHRGGQTLIFEDRDRFVPLLHEAHACPWHPSCESVGAVPDEPLNSVRRTRLSQKARRREKRKSLACEVTRGP